jgi:hypothetical protein
LKELKFGRTVSEPKSSETKVDPIFFLGRRKPWDDEYVLKRKFSALIPAFDPRPGRTNVNQVSIL